MLVSSLSGREKKVEFGKGAFSRVYTLDTRVSNLFVLVMLGYIPGYPHSICTLIEIHTGTKPGTFWSYSDIYPGIPGV